MNMQQNKGIEISEFWTRKKVHKFFNGVWNKCVIPVT
jgi:hypothetical protein